MSGPQTNTPSLPLALWVSLIAELEYGMEWLKSTRTSMRTLTFEHPDCEPIQWWTSSYSLLV